MNTLLCVAFALLPLAAYVVDRLATWQAERRWRRLTEQRRR